MSGTIRYLTDPALAPIFWPGVIVGLGVGVMCSALSVFVVLKRLSFIGQGISHAAFGGIGLAVALGLGAGAPQLGVVALFCLGSAWAVARLSDRRTTTADTAIGIVLVASMALGAILLSRAFRGAPRNWESILFGSIVGVGWADARLAWGVAAAIVVALWGARRSLLFWAFDEPAAEAFGVRGSRVRLLLMVLLTLAIVASMKLAGVVLATALLVLPGAAALHLSDRLRAVLALSLSIGVLGVIGGLVLSFESDWPTGPSIVSVLTVLYAAARIGGRMRRSD
ncbi:MAG: metal ABC transporter permease [Phycisphaerales bacterium]